MTSKLAKMIIEDYEPVAERFRLAVFPGTEEEIVDCLEESLSQDEIKALLKDREGRLVLAGHLSALFMAADISNSIVIIEEDLEDGGDDDGEPTTH